MIVTRTSSVVLTAALLAVAGSASAAFEIPNGTNFPWVRGTSYHSAYAEWNTFTAVVGGTNTPDVGSSVTGTLDVTAPAWNVTNVTPGAFLAGGNIYGFNGFAGVVTIPGFNFGAGETTTIIVQLHTLGTEVTANSILLDGVAPSSTTELSRTALAQGFAVETLYRFNLTGSNAGYTFNFTAAPHLSLERVAVDIYTTPAPGAAALLGLSGLIAGRRRR